MILEKNNLQTVQEWTKSYIELIVLYVRPPKKQESSSITLKSHKLALDGSRLGLENKLLENKWSRIFCVLYKIFLTIWGRVNQPFTLFIHYLRWNSTMSRFFYHTDLGQNTVFHNFEIRIALIQYSGRSKHTWAFSKTAKKISKSPILPAGCELWSVWMNINRVTLQHVYFLFSGFITMCNLQKRLIRAAFWVLLQAMFMNDWKQTAQRLKLQERLLTETETTIFVHKDEYQSVSKIPESSSLKFKFIF